MNSIIITCEHGGNRIPACFSHLFKNKSKLLNSHLGWDPGALELAKSIAARFRNSAFFYEKISRLVIDQNRSLTNKRVFSSITATLSLEQKSQIISTVYAPYHTAITSCIEKLLNNSSSVYHFSIHSFTPVLNGVVRDADMGLLYDPGMGLERDMCLRLTEKIKNEIPGIRIRRNYPYKGTSDGLTTALRMRFCNLKYAGIEIEMNQFHVLKKTRFWNAVKEMLPVCIGEIIGASNAPIQNQKP